MSFLLSLSQLNFQIASRYRMKQLALISQLLMIIGLFFFISKTIGEVAFLSGPYFPFVLSGLAFQHFLSGVASGSSSQLIEWRDQGVLEPILLSPQPAWKIYLKAGVSEYLRSFGKLILFLSSLFFIEGWSSLSSVDLDKTFLAIVIIAVMGISLSLIQCTGYLIFKRSHPSQFLSTFVHLFLSGIYFPIDILPTPLKILAQINPFYHALRILRSALAVGSPDTHLNSSLNSPLFLFFWIAIFSIIAILFYQYGEKRLSKEGGHIYL